MTAKIEPSSSVEPLIVITRMFDADRDLVWLAITDPMQVAQWYGGPGFTSPVCEMDLRPGGAWHHVMQAPDGTRYTINSVFEEVVAPERLAWRTLKDPNRNPAPPGNHVTVTLAARGARTEWKMVARFETLADRDLTAKMGFAHMIGMGLDRMAKHLESL
ncbi:MAG TPA: SRPBCC domain-containing protein [Xanthobacteraceae bacterium]|jgi:uncharacterized protein YndB with AHSA1/START domain